MSSFRELDSRKMRDRDATPGDRGSGGDLDTLTDGTSVPGATSGTEGYGDQDTGMGIGYSMGGRMAGNGEMGGSAEAGDSGGPDVTVMGEDEPNTRYGHADRDSGRTGQTTDMGSSGGTTG
jgi:hypothetical protein